MTGKTALVSLFLAAMLLSGGGTSGADILSYDEHINRGILYADQKNYDAAIGYYNQAIRINPYIPEAYNNRASAYAMKGDYYWALADFNEAIRL